jgi:hypothetical protein
MPFLFSNNATATLASSITTSSTSITLTTGNGALFPSISGSNYFYVTLTNSSNTIEIVKVTARSGDVLTVVRAQEGTTATAYAASDKVELRITAAGLTNFIQLDGAQTFTGTLTSSGGTLAGTWAGTPTFSGALTFSGNPIVANNTVISTKDSGGTTRNMLGCASDNNVNIYNAGNAAVRVMNQAGSAALVTLSDASGNLSATGNVSGSSDETLKTNWQDLPSTFLESLASLKRGVYDRVDVQLRQVGVSAQSLEAFLPDAVTTDVNGKKAVAYGNAALVACAELASRLLAVEAEIKMQKGA